MPDFAPEFCDVAVDGHVMTITLNRPERRNALHTDANHELGAVFDAFERNPELWIAVITGAGDKAFCAGADLVTAPSGGRPPVPESGFAGLVSRFNRRKPVIAAVNGMAMGGGFETALASDIVIAADTASFGLTEPRVGLAALGGGIQRVVEELGPKRAHALLLTGRKITAQDAHAMGIVAEVVPAGDLMATARRWADEIMECSPASIAATKAVVQSFDGHSVEHSMKDMFHLPEVRSLLTGPDAREGPTAFAQKRKPNWANPA
ncbi:enoyl-CoA hydratase/isomerase family protein [Novosphingobium sp. G106]|uniref:enoyl-CoA hydratase-related protein n=1 Tax=Novosphingobium sp. G106 TaxID=2849500 RepID=UPI001C2D64C9|nr:enoyl-CoA hydratase-related protein [Novosphingobium sp. G106]MBV1690604.1 enoyl-CoA hydratase/isomerase family protein [Novosphingobium sp. G106]